jgi:hypothetical protein
VTVAMSCSVPGAVAAAVALPAAAGADAGADAGVVGTSGWVSCMVHAPATAGAADIASRNVSFFMV